MRGYNRKNEIDIRFQVALASFYDTDGNDEAVNFDMDDDSTAPPAFPPSDDTASQPTARSTTDDAKSKEKARPRIATIHNMNRSSDEDEPQGQVRIG